MTSYAMATGYARTANYGQAFTQAEAVASPVSRKLAFRAALTAGAGLVLAVLVPGAALAGSSHAIGAHAVTGAHAASHAAIGP
jgi:hypothetical protein